MTKKIFGKDIGKWSENKLLCIFKYLSAYSNILSRVGYSKYYFIDGFAGTGFCVSRDTKKQIRGSAALALSINPPFNRYYFIDLDPKKVRNLENLKEMFPKLAIKIFNGDCNTEIDNILKEIESEMPFIALLDPQAGDLLWDTIVKISQKKKAELLINFPFGMAINRYLPLLKGKSLDANAKEKINKIFGSDEWFPIYQERRKNTITAKMARDRYLDIYLQGMKRLGFKYYAVKNLKNSRNVHIYYLIFATRNRKGLEKMKDHIIEAEQERHTLFFVQDLANLLYNEYCGAKLMTLDIILEKMLTGKRSQSAVSTQNCRGVMYKILASRLPAVRHGKLF